MPAMMDRAIRNLIVLALPYGSTDSPALGVFIFPALNSMYKIADVADVAVKSHRSF